MMFPLSKSSRTRSLTTSAVLLCAVLAGCLAGTDQGPLAAQDPEIPSSPVELRNTWSGLTLYRAGANLPPFTMAIGDWPTFCVIVPRDTTTLWAGLSWSTPNDMALELHGPDQVHRAGSSNALEEIELIGPLELTVHDPTPGVWLVFGSPSAFGGAVEWEINLVWTVDRPDVTLDATVYNEGPCY